MVCNMYDVSLVYHVFQTTVKVTRKQKHQLSVYIVFHILALQNTSLPKIVAYKIRTMKEMFRFFHDNKINQHSNHFSYFCFLVITFVQISISNITVMRCAIWYHQYNLNNVKNTHGEVFFLVNLQAKNFKIHTNTSPWAFFSPFLNCKNGTKSRKTSQISFSCYKTFL